MLYGGDMFVFLGVCIYACGPVSMRVGAGLSVPVFFVFVCLLLCFDVHECLFMFVCEHALLELSTF